MELLQIYHPQIPDFLARLADTKEMLRLKGVGMDCGCEYTNYPAYRGCPPASRYEHSLGVALIIWHFTRSMEQSIAGLFHDISTPVFSHTVDFLNRDYMQQESTEAGTEEIIRRSAQIGALLCEYGVDPEDVRDYHRYPIADNDSPRLSADRLEYTLRNFLRYERKTPEDIRRFYEDLTVCKNEDGQGRTDVSAPRNRGGVHTAGPQFFPPVCFRLRPVFHAVPGKAAWGRPFCARPDPGRSAHHGTGRHRQAFVPARNGGRLEPVLPAVQNPQPQRPSKRARLVSDPRQKAICGSHGLRKGQGLRLIGLPGKRDPGFYGN